MRCTSRTEKALLVVGRAQPVLVVIAISLGAVCCGGRPRPHLEVGVVARNPIRAVEAGVTTDANGDDHPRETRLFHYHLIVHSYAERIEEASFGGEPMRIVLDGAELIFDAEVVPSLDGVLLQEEPVVVGDEVWVPPFALGHNDYFVLEFKVLKEADHPTKPGISAIHADIEGIDSIGLQYEKS